MRTKREWEIHCLNYLRENKIFSVFWATENKFIANAMDRLVKKKTIKITKLQYPYSKVKIK